MAGVRGFRAGPRPVVPSRIKELREAAGIGRSELARFVGCTDKHINQIEEGKQSPSVSMLVRIRDVLACSLDDIYPQEKPIVVTA